MTCIDCGAPLKAKNRCGLRCKQCNSIHCAQFGGRGPYLPTEEEIRAACLETNTRRSVSALMDTRPWDE